MRQLLAKWLSKGEAVSVMGYTGDVYDSPPAVIRVAMTISCVFGAVLMLWHLIPTGLGIPIILTVSGLAFAIYLVWIVPRASQTAIVTLSYWTMLGVFALFLPLSI
ncbi:hypothetical protein JW859_00305 [bacterium]|nr:hypothetical protein [bacterium]